MSHLQRPRLRNLAALGLKRSLASILLLSSLSAPAFALPPMMQGYADHLSNIGVKPDAEALSQTGNFDDCLQYEMSIGMHTCPAFFFGFPVGMVPSPCLDFEYNEPDAIIQVMCSPGSRLGGTPSVAGAVLSAVPGQNEDNCTNPTVTKHGAIPAQFYDAIVRSTATPQTRLAMNSNPIQVAQSYTCGIAGVAGNMDLLANLQNFNLADTLNPSNWQGAIQGSVQNIQTSLQDLNMNSMFDNLGSMFNGDFLTNFFTGLQQMVTDFITSLQDMFQSLQTALQGLMNGGLSLDSLNMGDIGSMAQNMLGMGEAAGAAGGIQGDAGLFNLGAAATSAGNALNMLTKPGINPTQAGDLASAVNQALTLGMQGFIPGTQTASKDVIYAASFTPAHFAQSAGSLVVSATQGTQKPTIANLPKDSFVSWAFMATGVKGANGVQPGGFIQDGGSQVLFNQLTDNISVTVGWMDGVGRDTPVFLQKNLKSMSPADLCSTNLQIESTLAAAAKLKSAMGTDDSPTMVIPRGTYLNSTQYQVALKGVPVSSCPLTHAGFVAKQSDPSKLQVVNCTSVCTGGGDEPTVCRIVPKAGFGGACYSNVLSVQKENGLYPACNGVIPDKVANGTGGWRAAGGYKAEFDHIAKLNAQYRSQILASTDRAVAGLNQSKQVLKAELQANGGACTALGNPTGPKEWLASTPLPSSFITAQQGGMTPLADGVPINNDTVQGTFAMLDAMNLDMNLMNAASAMEGLGALGAYGVQNLTLAQANNVTGMLGLAPPVHVTFMPRKTVLSGVDPMSTLGSMPVNYGWQGGTYKSPNMIGDTFAMLDAQNGLVGEMMGCSSQLLLDIANPTVVHNANAINNTACWGNPNQYSGWTQHKMFGQHTIAARALKATIVQGGVPADTSPHPMQLDVTVPEKQEATTQGLPALGAPTGTNSKCYPQGSLNPGLTNVGSNPLSPENMFGAMKDQFDWKNAKTDTDSGELVITYWKNTKCCIPAACPYNVKQEY